MVKVIRYNNCKFQIFRVNNQWNMVCSTDEFIVYERKFKDYFEATSFVFEVIALYAGAEDDSTKSKQRSNI